MPNDKIREAHSSYTNEIRKVQQSTENWRDFLKFAAQLQISDEQYEFSSKLIIHSANPNAKDCREFDDWKSDGSYVKRFSKGIAVLTRDESGKQTVKHFFDISQTIIASPEHEMKSQSVVVNRVLEESILDFYAALQEKDITPNINITQKVIRRNLDKSSLSRIFSNLLNNAVKYSDGNLDITLEDDGKITFSNTASNMTDVQVERLFDRFYTLEDARKSTGLGLSIARLLIEQMNGTITAEYKDGKLYIYILFPCKEANSRN